MTMARLVSLLIMFALAVTNGPAIAMAMCQHEDARAHAAARHNPDAGVSAAARTEEAAAREAAKRGSLGDAATTLLAGYILPSDSPPLLPRSVEPTGGHSTHAPGLPSRSVPPLLEPPLA